MAEVDAWRLQMLELAQSFALPFQVLCVLACFSLGLFSVRAID